MDFNVGDKVFYTCSNGVWDRTTLVGFVLERSVHLEYFQDVIKVVNRRCKVESISFAIPSADSPPEVACMNILVRLTFPSSL